MSALQVRARRIGPALHIVPPPGRHDESTPIGFVCFKTELRACAAAIIVQGREPIPHVRFDVELAGTCPGTHERAVLRAVDELVCNAMEHGFYGRLHGRLALRVATRPGVGVDVAVSDDGWGFAARAPAEGNGFGLLRTLGMLRVEGALAASTMRTTVGVLIPF